MISNVIKFVKGESKLDQFTAETEKVAIYNGLSQKESLRLRLLSEEITGILRELVKNFDGSFWIENEKNVYSINFSIEANTIDDKSKQKLLELSTSGKNELARGFMGKIRKIIESFAISSQLVGDTCGYCMSTSDFYNMHKNVEAVLWSLDKYKKDVEGKSDWDELEKSIVANLADDVVVGVMGRKVTVSVKKSF